MKSNVTTLQMFLLYALIASSLGYYFLQQLDDERAVRKNVPKASVGKKVMLFFFLFMVCAILFYFIGNSLPFGSKGGAKNDVEMERPVMESMLQRIPDDMQTGIPPFKSMSFGG